MRLMAIHAHPDDESSKGAATCARYAAEGHEVMVVTCTGGERGTILNPYYPRQHVTRRQMAAIRRSEMAAAAAILGVRHRWLGFVDSGMDTPAPAGSFAAADPRRAVRAAVAAVREFRPHVIVTYDENGGYPHPDHIATHRAAVGAYHAAADPAQFPDAGEPWTVAKLYYVHIVTKDRVAALHEAMLHAGLTSPYSEWLAGWDDRGNRPVTTRVACERYYGVRSRALLAHASQVDPLSEWFQIPLEIQERSYPTEDFELALTRVAVPESERCLFTGIADDGRGSIRAGCEPATVTTPTGAGVGR